MRAIGVTEFGGPENLTVLDVPEPHPGPGEVRIRVHAATVNPTDSGLRSGRYKDRHKAQTGPFIPGADASGVVDEVGEGSRWSVGDRVAAVVVPFRPAGGAYVDELVVPDASVLRLPDDVDLPAGSTFLMNALTARLVLDELGLTPGQVLAVTGCRRSVRRVRRTDGQGGRPAGRRRRRGEGRGAGGRLGADTWCAAATTWPSGSARSCRRAWTAWWTARSRPSCTCPP